MAKNSFFDAIKDFTEDVPKEIAKESATITKLIFESILEESPYDSGRFIGNWHIGPTDISYSTLDKTTALIKQTEVLSVITPEYFMKYDKAYMVNNVDYAKRIEEDGWADMGGRGKYAPVGKTLGKFSGGIA